MGKINGHSLSECPNSKLSHGVQKLVYTAPLNNVFAVSDSAPKCSWHRNIDHTLNPHTKKVWERHEKIAPDVLSLIGNTPMVKLNKIPQKAGLKCNVYAKCEYLNPGGSVKDRIARRIIEDAEEQGILKPGYTIIEPSSGNTGIGMAMAAAVKGYRCIIVISEKMSNEKISVLNALGTETVRIPITADSYSLEGLFAIAHKLKKDIPNSIIFDQFTNPGNPLAHYDTTAEEILYQMDNKVDMIVMGAGTGGTVTGISRKIKEKSPNTKIIATDPEGSVFAQPETLNRTDVTFFEIEGLGYDFVPTALDRCVVDQWVKTNDEESFPLARRLIREEGILCGGSTGAIMAATLKAAKNLEEGQNVVMIIPDSIRNYITKFVSDHWMEARKLQPSVNKINHWWWEIPISSINLKQTLTLDTSSSCENALNVMKQHGICQIPVLGDKGEIMGVVTQQSIFNELISGNTGLSTVQRCITRIFPKSDNDSNLGHLSRMFEKDPYVVIFEKQSKISESNMDKLIGIAEASDLYNFICKNKNS